VYYHFKLGQLNGSSLGSQDNQIKGADIQIPIPPGSITVEKQTIPDGSDQSFDYSRDYDGA